ncbi:MAG: type II toxin-antitoxin system VapC family toxin [Gemmatimonadaceae bacterium]|nr:type II toxin-antitoxin system VapC family toxin [Gemmatimonadaceae bacterium]MCW5826773.1 type II toxin-antitoxin system VapC family toxin [Gemmatimonadaceae bacterium]
MRYLLDTSVCVHILRGHLPTVRRFADLGPDTVTLASMTLAELRYGEIRGHTPAVARARLATFLAACEILPFDEQAAEHHAHARLALAHVGTPIGERDLVIAATALAHGLVVATGNVREFRRVPGLGVEGWG